MRRVKSSERKKEEGKTNILCSSQWPLPLAGSSAATHQCIIKQFCFRSKFLVMLCAIFSKDRSLPNIFHCYMCFVVSLETVNIFVWGRYLKQFEDMKRIKRFSSLIRLFLCSGFPQYFNIYSKRQSDGNGRCESALFVCLMMPQLCRAHHIPPHNSFIIWR